MKVEKTITSIYEEKMFKGSKMKKYDVRNEWKMSKIKVQINVQEYLDACPSAMRVEW